MKQFLSFFVAIMISADASAKEWPLMRCSRNDKDIDACMLKAALESAPKIFNGLPLFKLPPIEPMKLGNFSMTAKKGPVSLEINFENAILTGVSKVRIDTAKYHKDIYRLDIGGFHKEIRLTAQYSMKGNILRLPVTSKGTADISFGNVLADHMVQFTPRSKLGINDQPNQKPSVNFYIDMKAINLMHFNLNARGYGSLANRALNEIMNSNWRLLYNAFKPSVEDWLHNIYTETMDTFFSNFDFDEFLPEN